MGLRGSGHEYDISALKWLIIFVRVFEGYMYSNFSKKFFLIRYKSYFTYIKNDLILNISIIEILTFNFS